MEDKILAYLNCNEELKKKLHVFKEAFIMYYGEQCREEIERKFSNAYYIGYYLPENMNINFLRKLGIQKTKEYIEKILSETTLEITQEDLCGNYSFDTETILPITFFSDFLEIYFQSPEERKEELIKKGFSYLKDKIPSLTEEEYREIFRTKIIPPKYDGLPEWLRNNFEYLINDDNIEIKYKEAYKNVENLLKKIDPEINEENFEKKLVEPKFLELIEVSKKVKASIVDYKKYKAKHQKYYDEVEKIDKLKRDINERLTKEFILENQDLLPEEKRTGLEDTLKNTKLFDIDRCVKNVFGTSIHYLLDITYFSSKKEEELQSDKTSEFEKNTIRRNRINYFKSIGIDLGNDYSVYENSEEARKAWPSCERIDKLIESKNNYINRYNIEFYSSTDSFKKIRKDLDELNLIDSGLSARHYVQKITCVSTNFRKTENSLEQYPLVIINFDDVDGNGKDHDIVHELNHLFELMITSDGKTYNGVCGWDLLYGPIDDSNEEKNTLAKDERRHYELFNEIINELIAQDICELMHKNNMHVFDEPDKSVYRGRTSYEDSLVLVKDFFNEFKDKIIESRRNGNIQVIFDEVGKENFDELNSLFSIFNENFSGFKKLRLRNSILRKEDNEMTRLYFEILEKRDNILNKMRMHSASKMSTETDQLSNPNVMS